MQAHSGIYAGVLWIAILRILSSVQVKGPPPFHNVHNVECRWLLVRWCANTRRLSCAGRDGASRCNMRPWRLPGFLLKRGSLRMGRSWNGSKYSNIWADYYPMMIMIPRPWGATLPRHVGVGCKSSECWGQRMLRTRFVVFFTKEQYKQCCFLGVRCEIWCHWVWRVWKAFTWELPGACWAVILGRDLMARKSTQTWRRFFGMWDCNA